MQLKKDMLPALPVLANGCISKSSLRDFFFNYSRFHFLQTIQVMCEADAEFRIKYSKYRFKKLLPKNIAIEILQHNEWILGQDYTLDKT
jgi:hypothetical protein